MCLTSSIRKFSQIQHLSSIYIALPFDSLPKNYCDSLCVTVNRPCLQCGWSCSASEELRVGELPVLYFLKSMLFISPLPFTCMQRNTDRSASLCQVLHHTLSLFSPQTWSKGLESPLLRLKHNNTLKSPKEQALFCSKKKKKSIST